MESSQYRILVQQGVVHHPPNGPMVLHRPLRAATRANVAKNQEHHRSRKNFKRNQIHLRRIHSPFYKAWARREMVLLFRFGRSWWLLIVDSRCCFVWSACLFFMEQELERWRRLLESSLSVQLTTPKNWWRRVQLKKCVVGEWPHLYEIKHIRPWLIPNPNYFAYLIPRSQKSAGVSERDETRSWFGRCQFPLYLEEVDTIAWSKLMAIIEFAGSALAL